MGNIKILPSEIAGRIAAGEVIERPASVVKELVENSIDAGATRIKINIEDGGHKLIQVIDNGCGMDREDALLCLEAHATSKITESGDVGQIHTLGFRGEAIPSISAVSQFQLQTKCRNALSGTEIIVSDGCISNVTDCGCAEGTNIRAAYIFGNLPARRKFLKSPATEEANIEETVLLLALSRPDIAFELTMNRRNAIRIPASDNIAVRAELLIGKDDFASMIPVDYREDEVHIYGFISRPGFTRSNRREQRIIVNGRAAAAETVFFAIRTAYDSLVVKGRYPAAILYIDLPDDRVDVNVHPAKREVRFREPIKIANILGSAIRLALRKSGIDIAESSSLPSSENTDSPQIIEPFQPNDIIPHTHVPATAQSAAPAPVQPAMPKAAFQPEIPLPTANPTVVAPDHPVPPEENTLGLPGSFIPICQLHERYLLAESSEGLIIISIKAARQRIAFEHILQNLSQQQPASQQLLMPVTINLAPSESKLLQSHLDDFKSLGYILEPFGGYTWLATAVPANTTDSNLPEILHDILSDLRNDDSVERQSSARLARIAAQHAIFVGSKPLSPDEQRQLINSLIRCKMPYACPAGHPTMINITAAELNRRFDK